MNWERLLSPKRFQDPNRPDIEQRSVFQRDSDRITFSAAFRRLQDKTQVHPFATSDYVRKRLTHSLEVSSVGRSLGFWLGTRLSKQNPDLLFKNPALAFDVAQIVSNACLAHDIGNPPFGHAGEEAIGSWFNVNASEEQLKNLDEHQLSDFQSFEGNAQGFRLITRLQNSINTGGLRLTYATLGAFTKYPATSVQAASDDKYIGCKKYGFFKDDQDHFAEVAEDLGLIRRYNGSWCRHPLVYLVEAADDICYKIVDVEDGFKLGRLTFDEAEQCLVNMLSSDRVYKRELDQNSNIGWLRAHAIGSLIDAVQVTFEENEVSILDGSFADALIDVCSSASAIKAAKALVVERVFEWDRTIAAEIAGSEMITFILERCMSAIYDPRPKMNSLILKLIPGYDESESLVKKIHSVTDFVSGMTDTYLKTTYLKFSGHLI